MPSHPCAAPGRRCTGRRARSPGRRCNRLSQRPGLLWRRWWMRGWSGAAHCTRQRGAGQVGTLGGGGGPEGGRPSTVRIQPAGAGEGGRGREHPSAPAQAGAWAAQGAPRPAPTPGPRAPPTRPPAHGLQGHRREQLLGKEAWRPVVVCAHTARGQPGAATTSRGAVASVSDFGPTRLCPCSLVA